MKREKKIEEDAAQVCAAVSESCSCHYGQQKYLKKIEVAKIFGVTTRTIDNWMRLGKITYSKINSTIRFSKEDIDICFTSHKHNASIDELL
jgi:transposase